VAVQGRRDLRHEPGLARPRLAADDDHLAVTRARGVPGTLEDVELAAPSDEGWKGRPRPAGRKRR